MKVRKAKSNTNSNNIQDNKDTPPQKGERVQVFVRIRPFNEEELEKDNTSPIEVVDTENNALICNKKIITKIYNFLSQFAENTTKKILVMIEYLPKIKLRKKFFQ